MFLVGQSVVRYVSGASQDLQVLVGGRDAAAARPDRGHGRPGHRGRGRYGRRASAPAWLASSRFPTGTAAPFEPTPGRHADLAVLLAGLVADPARWSSAARCSRPGRRRAPSVPSAAAGAPGSPASPPGPARRCPLTVGASFALDRGRGAQAVPVFPALVGAVVGVLGVVAALTFAAGVDDAAAHPERFGQVSELQAFIGFNGEDFVPRDDVLAALAADPDVAAVNDTRQGVLESGRIDLAAFVLDPVDDPLPIVVLDGRLPRARRRGRHRHRVGRRASARPSATPSSSPARGPRAPTWSTGIAFVPEGSHNEYDAGAWILPATYDDLIEGFKFHTAEVSLRDGSRPRRRGGPSRRGRGRGRRACRPRPPAEVVTQRTPPSRLAELREVQRLPLLLAAFLALLAVAAVGHAVATAVRRRRHDLAVLRALGVTRRQSRADRADPGDRAGRWSDSCSACRSGFALGRTLWRSVADTTPIDYVPPVAVWALVLIAPVALLAAALLAAWPSHRAASLRVAHVLRTE